MIITIASVVAFAPGLLNGVYGGTKAFVLGFSQSLRHELANTGVKVQVVLPGATATSFWKKAGGPGQWDYEAARQALMPNLSRAEPAGRYGVVRAAA